MKTENPDATRGFAISLKRAQFFFSNTTNVLKTNFIKNGWSWCKHLLSYLVKKNIVSSFHCFRLSVLSAPDEMQRQILV